MTYLPLLFCMLGLAPVLSRASAIRAMPLITSTECFFGLKEQTRCSGVSTAPTVAAFTWAEWRIRKMEANSSPGRRGRKKKQSLKERKLIWWICCFPCINLKNLLWTHQPSLDKTQALKWVKFDLIWWSLYIDVFLSEDSRQLGHTCIFGNTQETRYI